MKIILISEFKAKCIGLLKNVQKTKERILITLRAEPIMRGEPVVKAKKRVRLGAYRDLSLIAADGSNPAVSVCENRLRKEVAHS